MSRLRHFLLLFLAFLLIPQQVLAAPVFTDVSSDHPNFQAIQALHEQGVIEGYANNTYRPDQFVNRAETLKIILLGSEIYVPDIQNQEIFPDVVPGVWYAKYVVKAKNLAIIQGDDITGLFRPGDTINLAEILKILLKTNEIETRVPSRHPYADVPPDAWFAPYFDYAEFIGLLDQDSSELVNPATPVTRGFMAELMYRLSQKPKADDYGTASFYGDQFHGRTTASGEVFDASGFTAAHREYPFGTFLRVTNAANGKEVQVRVNDRGPYVSDDRVIDLSKAAFETLAPLSRGVIRVTVEILPSSFETSDETGQEDDREVIDETPSPEPLRADFLNTERSSCPERNDLSYLDRRSFNSIELTNDIPTHVVPEEVLTVRGRVLNNTNKVTVFFVDEEGKQSAFTGEVQDGQFAIPFHLPEEGRYDLGVLPVEMGTSIIKPIQALPYTCLLEIENAALPAPSVPTGILNQGEGRLQWTGEGFNLFHLSFIQEGVRERFLFRDENEWQPYYLDFADFREGPVTVYLRQANLANRSVLEADQIEWSPTVTMELQAITHHEFIVEKDQIRVLRFPDPIQPGELIRLRFTPKVSFRSEAAIILPNGEVQTVMLPGEEGQDVLPAEGQTLTFQYRIQDQGIHFVEINNTQGLAALNIPLYPEDSFPMIPNPAEREERSTVNLGNDLSALRNQFLALVNSDRRAHGRIEVALDPALNQLAQFKSDDMARNNYFGHWDAEGRDANDLRVNYGIAQVVSENLAKEVTIPLAQYGLMRSAIHRKNILDPLWTRVGLGISQNQDGTYTFVQIFSEDPFDMTNLSALRENILDTINDQRSLALTLQSNLNDLAQNWSERMVDQDFFAFTDPAGNSIFDRIEEANLNTRVGTYIAGNTRWSDVLRQIGDNVTLRDSSWKNVGIGIRQDNLGVFKVTLIYAE